MRKKLFTKEQEQQADQKDILEVARNLGLPLEKKHGEIRANGYGGLVIAPEKNKWICFSAQLEGQKIYGGGPIQLVMYIRNCDFKEAMCYLLGTQIEERPFQQPKKKTRKPFQLPNAADDFRHVYAYLLKTRKIDRRVVEYFVKEKMIYENTYHSCVFVGYDFSGKPRHCSIRGTVSQNAFKGETPGSDKRFTFHKIGTTNVLHVYEAPIDMLSYMTLYHNVWKDNHVALCCLADKALAEYVKHISGIKKIFLHLDNDRWGDGQTEKFCKIYGRVFEVWDERPDRQFKDWNEALVFLRGEE